MHSSHRSKGVFLPRLPALWVGVAVFLAAAGCSFAQASPGYYATAEGKQGAALKAALHAVIHGHTVIPYSSSTKFDTSDALKVLDEAPGDPTSVRLIYSGLTEPKDSFATAAGWTREHLWCDSYGIDDIMPSYSDLHNLRAIDSNVNSSRGNDPYDDSDKSSAKYKSPAFAEAPGTSRDEDSWEPPDNQKGDIARALFYMAVRYEGDAANEPDLELTDDVGSINSSVALMGKLTTLILWSELDPVSPEEIVRNNGVESYQHNRNPFVDHPEWVTAVFGDPLKLDATPGEGTLTLTWSGALHRVVLEQSTDLVTWTDYAPQPVSSSSSTTFTVTVPAAEGRRFFRLEVK